LQEVAKFSSYLYPLAGAPYAIIANKRAWNALPPDLQAVAKEAADWVLEESKKEAVDYISDAVVAELIAVGHKVLPPFPEADQKAIQKASFEVWLKLASEISPTMVEDVKKIMAKLAE
ncbi:MAG: hypothetical protein AB7P02_14700, partial [Alphaproteobacteria bacterium]